MYTDDNSALVDAMGMSDVQQAALRKLAGQEMAPSGWSMRGIPHDVRRATVTGLVERGMAETDYSQGGFWGPDRLVRWRLTEAGRAALAAMAGGAGPCS